MSWRNTLASLTWLLVDELLVEAVVLSDEVLDEVDVLLDWS